MVITGGRGKSFNNKRICLGGNIDLQASRGAMVAVLGRYFEYLEACVLLLSFL